MHNYTENIGVGQNHKTFWVMDIETNTAWKKDGGGYSPAAVWMYLGCLLSSNGTYTFFNSWEAYKGALEIVPSGTIIFVHNLSYEFEFLCRNGFRFEKIIANKKHKIISATDKDRGIIYRCSYKLLDKSLKDIGESIGLPKLDYAYSGIRTKENLVEKDYRYNLRDCEIVVKAINRELDVYGSLDKLPLTKTGKVRKYIMENDNGELAARARNAFPSEDIYQLLEDAFIGGTCFGNPQSFAQIVENVYSYDKKSSYPAVMLSKRFPVKFSQIYTGERAQRIFDNTPNDVQFIGTFRLSGISPKDRRILFLPKYKCKAGSTGLYTFNGKIVSGDLAIMTLDSVTLRMAFEVYNIENIECVEIALATSVRRLPNAFIKTIAQLAETKNRLSKTKDESPENAEEYARFKELINAIYGAMVQKFRNFEYSVDDMGVWESDEQPYKRPSRLFRIYAVGVWVTAYARDSLFRDGILRVGADSFVYADTDSVKTTKPLRITEYFDRDTKDYLQSVLDKNEYEAIKNFGKFEEEIKNFCDKFMHLGAKKYFYEKKGKFGYTVSGLPKPEKIRKNGGTFPKSFRDVRDGAPEFYNVKLSHKFLSNNIDKIPVYEKREVRYISGENETVRARFFPLERKIISGFGGVALYPASYTLTARPLDCDYCQDYGCTWVGSVPNTKSEHIDIERLDYILRHFDLWG